MNRPIGVFDSGIGGITVLKELQRILPREHYVYLGDTARVPYGTRSSQTVIEYSLELLEELIKRDVKAIVVACNTITSWAMPHLQELVDGMGIPIIGVVNPGIQQAKTVTRGHVGVIATASTIHSRVYEDGLKNVFPNVTVHSVACPVFVSLAEEGWYEDLTADLIAEKYLGHLRGKIDTLILGCTHFPLLGYAIQRVLPKVVIVDPAIFTAKLLRKQLIAEGMSHQGAEGSCTYLVTDNPDKFREIGGRLLQQPLENVELIRIPSRNSS